MIFKGQIINLREAESSDIPQISGWLLDEEFRYFLHGSSLDQPAQIQKQLSIMIEKKIGVFEAENYLMLENKNGKILGLSILRAPDWKNQNLLFEILIADKENRKKNLGWAAILAVLDYSFNELNMHKVCARVYSFNQPVRHILEKSRQLFGARLEGVLRNHVYRKGEFFDVWVYGLLKSDYQKSLQSAVCQNFVKACFINS